VNVDRLTDEHGRVLADNAYGEQHDDAARRDFTINALYYDPTTGEWREIVFTGRPPPTAESDGKGGFR